MSETEFGLAAVYRIIKKSGAERVSDEAAEEFAGCLKRWLVKLQSKRRRLSVHAGRHTVKAADVKLAAKTILGEK